MLNCTTSKDVWITLHSLFATQSTAHVMQTQYQLATLKKGYESITYYFHKAKTLVATFGAARQSFSSSEFSVNLLAGLGSDYDSFSHLPHHMHQIYSFLLNYKSWLAHQTQTLLSGNPIWVHLTTSKPTHLSTTSHRGRGSRPFRGRREGSRTNSNFFFQSFRFSIILSSL